MKISFNWLKEYIAITDKIIDEDLHFYWAGSCRGNLFNDEEDMEIMEKMKKAGCISMAYSLESADPDILKAMNKHVSVEQFSRQTELFHKAGIPVGTSLVFGYPQESPETIKKTFDCCIKNSIYPSSGYLLPQPGSKMYQYAVEHDFITDEEEYLLLMGDRQDLRLNMTQMPDKELEDHIMEGLKRCNKALNTGLEKQDLIKTTYYRSRKK